MNNTTPVIATKPVAVRIAESIAFSAADHRNGNRAPMEAEVLKYFGRAELTKIEDAIRHAIDPQISAFNVVCEIQGIKHG